MIQLRKRRLPIAVLHLSMHAIRLPASLKSVVLRKSSRFVTVLPLSVIAAREANGAKEEMCEKTEERPKGSRCVMSEARATRTSLGRSSAPLGWTAFARESVQH